MHSPLSRQQYKKKSDNISLNLEPYIKVEKERVSRSRVLFHSIRFNLDKNILKSIQLAQETSQNLEISRELLGDLRYYALIDGESRLQSGLTFCTYYEFNNLTEAVMRTVISTDGDIFHQIKHDCLESPDFGLEIASAHYWLIDQLLSQLRLQALIKLNFLSWSLSLLIVGSTVIPNIEKFIDNPWLMLAPPLMTWLLQVGIKRLLRLFLPILGRVLMRRLLSSLLSRQPLEKKLAKGIWAWFVA